MNELDTDFDHWRSMQPDDVLKMDLIQQAAHYASDVAWHDRLDDAEYELRDAVIVFDGAEPEAG